MEDDTHNETKEKVEITGETAPPQGDIPTADSSAEAEPVKQAANGQKYSLKLAGVITAGLLLLALVGYAGWRLGHHTSTPVATATQTQASTQTTPTTTATVQGLQLDTSKNYGNKYADGVVPVGDGKYETTGAKQGYVYACAAYARNLAADAGGAGKRGPWFIGTTEYNINKKINVQGAVHWNGVFTNTVSGGTRTITSNDLPLAHTTGIFPIKASDPAYVYDRNPNTITAQSFTYALSANPTYGSPNCVGGQVGVMLSGVSMFSALDAGGRDAGAWETQDACQGHPQSAGEYHYHTMSSCITDQSVHDVIGFALDGFPITGPQVSANNILTTSDLDECHGIVSQITLDGKSVTMYHYVMTQDFPYSVSCYRAQAITPPGQPEQPNLHP